MEKRGRGTAQSGGMDEEDRIAKLEERQEARAWRERLYYLEGI